MHGSKQKTLNTACNPKAQTIKGDLDLKEERENQPKTPATDRGIFSMNLASG